MAEKLNIKEWNEEDRPREKLSRLGAGALTDAELLAILIGSGSAKETSVALMQRVLNDCNNKFRWVKFYLDDDNDIVANADILFDELNVGFTCVEIVMRTASIIDDAYPAIMKGIWG